MSLIPDKIYIYIHLKDKIQKWVEIFINLKVLNSRTRAIINYNARDR